MQDVLVYDKMKYNFTIININIIKGLKMKKLISVLKIILAIAFAVISAFIVINIVKIRNAQAFVKVVTDREVEYFNDESFFLNTYYKFKDDENIEYWINKQTGQFSCLINNELKKDKKISEKKAKAIAYEEAEKWDSNFLSNDVFIETIDNDTYVFYIFQLNESGYRTGKFITVEIASDKIRQISMQTTIEQLCLISEEKAMDIAYRATTETSTTLNMEENHLTKVYFRVSSKNKVYLAPLSITPESYYWDITISGITADTITNKRDSVSHYPKFICTVDAVNGDIISSEWVEDTE